MAHYMLEPVQRIPRYKLLLKGLILISDNSGSIIVRGKE